MIATENAKDSQEDGWLTLKSQGLTERQIASEVGIPRSTIRDGLKRAKLREGLRSTGETKPRRLVEIYGSSCKALKLLRCQDVHPCPTCRGIPVTVEWDEVIECPECPGMSCPLCHGERMISLPRCVSVDCETCNGTGIGPIPKGSRCCCGTCAESGLDHLPGYYLNAVERRQIELDHRIAEMARKTLTRLRRIKGGRK